MLIRCYKDSDLEAVATLFADTVRHVNARDYSPKQIAAWAPPGPPDLAHWCKRLSGLTLWVAETSHCVICFCGLRTDGYLDFLYVDYQFQRQGVALVLYRQVEMETQRLGISRLFIEASITARPFFEKMGFKVVREQEVKVRGAMLRNFAMEKRVG